MVERTKRRGLVLVVIDNRTKETLNSQTIAHVGKNSTIHTDCWKGYTDVKNIVSEHRTINHSRGFVNPVDETHTNTIEGCWYAIKMQVPVRNRTSSKIGLYLLRFMLLMLESLRQQEASFIAKEPEDLKMPRLVQPELEELF